MRFNIGSKIKINGKQGEIIDIIAGIADIVYYTIQFSDPYDHMVMSKAELCAALQHNTNTKETEKKNDNELWEILRKIISNKHKVLSMLDVQNVEELIEKYSEQDIINLFRPFNVNDVVYVPVPNIDGSKQKGVITCVRDDIITVLLSDGSFITGGKDNFIRTGATLDITSVLQNPVIVI